MLWQPDRRKLLAGGAGLLLSGCDALAGSDKARAVIGSGEQATYRWQRLIGRDGLAQEFSAADISPVFKVNGTHEPVEAAYQALKAGGWADWRLAVTGLVARPLALSLADIRKLPQRSQITRHDCVEGWSAIAGWQGPQLADVLAQAGVSSKARYVVFRCADNYGGEAAKGGQQSSSLYYESVDMVDALHPQTILAHSMNGAPLTPGHGAPLRLRVERQLGYKQAKYLMELVVTDSFAGFGQGKGGYWPDRGYEWYAGI